MASSKITWGATSLIGALMNLSYAAAGELEPGPLKPVCRLWLSFLEGLGLSSYALFWTLLLLGSILVSFETLRTGLPGFFSTTGGFLGSYTVLVGVMYRDIAYFSLGLLLFFAGLAVAAEADKARMREEHRTEYL